MEPVYGTALIAFLSALATTLVTQAFTLKSSQASIRNDYKKIYFEKQLIAYQILWSHLRPLSRFYSSKTIFRETQKDSKGKKTYILDRQNSTEFCELITDFYFSEHGLLISRETRNLIFALRNLLGYIVHCHKDIKDSEIQIDKDKVRRINRLSGEIFAVVRKDIGLLNFLLDIEELGLIEKNNKQTLATQINKIRTSANSIKSKG